MANWEQQERELVAVEVAMVANQNKEKLKIERWMKLWHEKVKDELS